MSIKDSSFPFSLKWEVGSFMVTFMQFRQELILTSGGPRYAIEKKEKKKKMEKIYTMYSVPILMTFQSMSLL